MSSTPAVRLRPRRRAPERRRTSAPCGKVDPVFRSQRCASLECTHRINPKSGVHFWVRCWKGSGWRMGVAHGNRTDLSCHCDTKRVNSRLTPSLIDRPLCGFSTRQGPLPTQGLIDDLLQIVMPRRPAEAANAVDPGHELGRIARSPGAQADLEIDSGDLLDHVDDLENGSAVAVAAIHDRAV